VCANVLYHFSDTSLCNWSVADSVSFDDMLAPFTGIMLGGNVTGVYRSDESGQHWSPCTNGIHAQQERSLFVDREDLLWYAGAVSTDHGRSWEERICSGNAYHFFSDADGWYYAWHYSPAPYMFRSADGRNWEEVTTLPLRQPIYGMKQAGRWLLCAGNLGLMRSSDHGDTWEWLMASDVHEAIEGKNGRLYITTFYTGVRRSDSTWKEWETVSDGLPRDEYGNIHSFAIATDPHGVLYCSVYIGGGLYRSRDGGDSWEQVLSEEAPILDILIVDENLIVLATNGHGVLISEDSGENWSELNDGLTNWTILHLHIDHAGYLYAASMGSGLYRSRMSLYPCSRSLILSGDEGITGYSGLTIDLPVHLQPQLHPYDDLRLSADLRWDPRFLRFERVTHDSTSSLHIDAWVLEPGKLMLGIDGTGRNVPDPIVSLRFRVKEIDVNPTVTSLQFGLINAITQCKTQITAEHMTVNLHRPKRWGMEVWPNPAVTDQLNIRVSAPYSGEVNIVLSDIPGQVNRTLYRGSISQGTWIIPVEVRGIASGNYWITLTGNGISETRHIQYLK
jgi:photosystem II stability/assembly factor-like uncharacterized protein